MRRPGRQRRIRVGHGAAGVVVSVKLDVAGDDAAQGPHDLVHAQRVGHTDRVGDADARDAELVHLAIDGEQIDQVAPEAILAGEPDLQAVALDELDHLGGRLDDLGDVAAVGELPQQTGGPEQDVDAVDAGLHGDPGVFHVAAGVGEHLRLQAESRDALAVAPGAGAGGG